MFEFICIKNMNKIPVSFNTEINDFFECGECFKCENNERCLSTMCIKCLGCNKELLCIMEVFGLTSNALYFYCNDCSYSSIACYECLQKNGDYTYLMNIHELQTGKEFPPSTDYTVSSMNDMPSICFNNTEMCCYDDKKYMCLGGKWGMLTGPDGGYESHWKCGKCGYELYFTDK
jgi:hypothetical protein